MEASVAVAEPRERQVLTHSRLSCNRACPRRHYLQYELGLRPEEEGYALRVGSGFHAMQEADGKDEDPELALLAIDLKSEYDRALVAGMFTGHQDYWSDDSLEFADSTINVVATEISFEMPPTNPRTGAATPIWNLGGKIDKIIRLSDGRLALMEYKTTSRDFTPGSDYWVKLQMDQQISIYVIAARYRGYDVETILYDVTRRPGQQPLKATAEEKRKYKKDGELYANQRDVDETPEEFAIRIGGVIASDPGKHYARIEIPRLEQDLDDCRGEVWAQQLTIRSAQRDGFWYRNPDSCFEPFPCNYLPICQNRDLEDVTPSGFIKIENVNPELTGIALVEG